MTDILLATYNGEKYLPELLDSLVAQGYGDFQIIARDDGSSDGTLKVLNDYQRRYPRKLVSVIAGKGTGSSKANFFKLLAYSDSDYTMFCDQDDVWMKDKVERTMDAMRRAESEAYGMPMLVHTDLRVVDDGLREINASFFAMQKLDSEAVSLNKLLAQNNVTGCTLMINRDLRLLVKESPKALMHDWWLALIAAAFGRIVFLPEATVLYRQHQSNSVGAKDVSKAAYIKEKARDTAGVRESIRATYSQAQGFDEAYAGLLSGNQKKLIEQYSSLQNMSIFKRMQVINKYNYSKNGMYRKIGQVLFG